MDRTQAYDAHMNLVLSEVEETVSIVDVSENGVAQGVRVSLSVSFLVLQSSVNGEKVVTIVQGRRGSICLCKQE